MNADTLTITPRDSATVSARDADLLAAGIRTKRDGAGKVRGYDVAGKHYAKRGDAIAAATDLATERDTRAAKRTRKVAPTLARLTKRERSKLSADGKYAAALARLASANVEPTIARVAHITGMTPSSVRRAIKRAARASA